MSLLLDALQRASKEKEKLAESRGAGTASSDASPPVEPVLERSPFPALSIETDEQAGDVMPAMELTMEMEPVVPEVTVSQPRVRVHDPLPASETSQSFVIPAIASAPDGKVQHTPAGIPDENCNIPPSSAVAEIAAVLAVDAGEVAAPSLSAKAPETKPEFENATRKEPKPGQGEPASPQKTTGPANHPGPKLSPQVAREILGATAKRPPNRRAIAIGAAAALIATAYLAFFLGAFDPLFGKSGSSLTPSLPPPAAVAVLPAPTPPAAVPDIAPTDGEGDKARDAGLAAADLGLVKETAPLRAPKAPRRKAVASTTDQAAEASSERSTARGADSRRPVVVTRAVTTNPLDAAYAAMTEGRLDEAANAYRKALVANPGERDAFLGLAYIAQRKGNNDEARALYLQVLRLDPANSGANSGLLAIASEGDLPAAASRAREMAERAPDSAVVMGTLGGILAKEGRIAEAQQAYFRALTLEPENAFHAFNLAVALDKLHKTAQALSFYQRSLVLAEKAPEADRSGFPFNEARQRVGQLRQPAGVPQAPSRSDSQGR